jgi:uncharacterized repeat protein (TIGR03803 family)
MSPAVPADITNGATQSSASSLALQQSAFTYKSLYSFKGTPDGADPLAGLAVANGSLYGTTYSGGAGGDGTVFAVSTSGAERVLHSFSGAPDGAYPYADLTELNGLLYGTTAFGGTNGSLAAGDGTVFEVNTSGTERVIFSFQANTIGALPEASLSNVGGVLYGTTTLLIRDKVMSYHERIACRWCGEERFDFVRHAAQ